MDDGTPPSAEDQVAAETFRAIFPNGLPGPRPASGTAIVRHFPLEPDHLAALANSNAAGEVLGVDPAPRLKMSRTHHRLAQLLAMGMDEGQAGFVCNYGPSTVSILRTDPLFQELEHYYSLQVEYEFQTVAQQMADLHEDVVNELRVRMEDNPQQFTIKTLTDLLTALADRTGHGPSSNVNANVNILAVNGADLERIKSTPSARSLRGDGQVGQLTEEDRQSLSGVFTLSADDVTLLPLDQGVGPSEGDGLREASPPQVEDGVVANSGDTQP